MRLFMYCHMPRWWHASFVVDGARIPIQSLFQPFRVIGHITCYFTAHCDFPFCPKAKLALLAKTLFDVTICFEKSLPAVFPRYTWLLRYCKSKMDFKLLLTKTKIKMARYIRFHTCCFLDLTKCRPTVTATFSWPCDCKCQHTLHVPSQLLSLQHFAQKFSLVIRAAAILDPPGFRYSFVSPIVVFIVPHWTHIASVCSDVYLPLASTVNIHHSHWCCQVTTCRF